MATLTIRKLEDATLEAFKASAKANNRSTEAEARSLIEDFVAGRIVRHEMEQSNFYDRLRDFMANEGIAGFGAGELPVEDRNHADERPQVVFDDGREERDRNERDRDEAGS